MDGTMLKVMKYCFVVMMVLVASGSLVGEASAGKYKAIELSGDQLAAVNRINDYINSFATMRGDFTQISPRGQSSRGVMLISKPGKIRFEYAPPVPLLIVSDGKWLTIKNTARERGDQFPLSATPLRLVVSDKVNLLGETDVIAFQQAEGLTSVTLQDKKGKLGGYIILIYDDVNKSLQQWVVVDGKGKRTTVQLANLETGVKIDPKLFVVKIDRDKNKKN
jgi:outer membrane lipoprotein-sorting protein